MFYISITLTAVDLEQMREISFVREVNEEDMQDILLLQALQPATESVEERTAMFKVVYMLLRKGGNVISNDMSKAGKKMEKLLRNFANNLPPSNWNLTRMCPVGAFAHISL